MRATQARNERERDAAIAAAVAEAVSNLRQPESSGTVGRERERVQQ